MLFRPDCRPEEVTRWTLAAAVAACEAARDLTSAAIEIKWPNDLLWSGRKLAGILTEVRGAGRGAGELVVGTGWNVMHQPSDFPAELGRQATSLWAAGGGRGPEREQVAGGYLCRLGQLARLLTDGQWPEVARSWERLAPESRGRRVRLLADAPDGESAEGVTEGIDELGALLVRRDDGVVQAVRLAESVVRLESRPCC